MGKDIIGVSRKRVAVPRMDLTPIPSPDESSDSEESGSELSHSRSASSLPSVASS